MRVLDTTACAIADAMVEASAQDTLFAWFRERGVRCKGARAFIEQSGCSTTLEAAIFLRFQLAPLHLANSDNVNNDMKALLGCSPAVALRVIRDLDVYSKPPFPTVHADVACAVHGVCKAVRM